MRRQFCTLLLLLLAACQPWRLAVAEDTATRCLKLGFTGLQLCSDCDAMANFVKDAGLVQECRQCCTKDANPSANKYESAVLEVCPHRVSAYPHIQEFIRKHSEDWEGLSVRYRAGSRPNLKLLGGTGGARESIRIDNWKTEHVVEFLKDKLVDADVDGS